MVSRPNALSHDLSCDFKSAISPRCNGFFQFGQFRFRQVLDSTQRLRPYRDNVGIRS